jgi:hypothetical protein
MKTRITIWAICVVALIAWTGLAFAQAAKPAAMKTVKLSNGQEVFDISGEWDVIIECYGEWAQFGTYPNVAKISIKQDDGSFHAIRLKANPPPSNLPAGTFLMIGDLDKNGIKKLELVAGDGPRIPSTWQISENGNKINIDGPQRARLTLTRK